jgi:hypothetical protein
MLYGANIYFCFAAALPVPESEMPTDGLDGSLLRIVSEPPAPPATLGWNVTTIGDLALRAERRFAASEDENGAAGGFIITTRSLLPAFLIFRLFDFAAPTLTLPNLIERALSERMLPGSGATLTGVGGEVSCGLGVAVAVGVGDRVGVAVPLGVAVGVAVEVAVAVAVAEGVAVGVGAG